MEFNSLEDAIKVFKSSAVKHLMEHDHSVDVENKEDVKQFLRENPTYVRDLALQIVAVSGGLPDGYVPEQNDHKHPAGSSQSLPANVRYVFYPEAEWTSYKAQIDETAKDNKNVRSELDKITAKYKSLAERMNKNHKETQAKFATDQLTMTELEEDIGSLEQHTKKMRSTVKRPYRLNSKGSIVCRIRCKDWNAKHKCASRSCPLVHLCLICGGGHPSLDCPGGTSLPIAGPSTVVDKSDHSDDSDDAGPPAKKARKVIPQKGPSFKGPTTRARGSLNGA